VHLPFGVRESSEDQDTRHLHLLSCVSLAQRGNLMSAFLL
jgi:hypothetical protein